MKTIKLTDTVDISIKVNIKCSAEIEDNIKYFLPDINIMDQRPIKKYHSKAIQKKARVSAIQISHWTKTGVIVPATAVKGTGKMHVFDHQNLIEAMICRELSQYSINIGVMREVLDFLRVKKWLFDIGLAMDHPKTETISDGVVTGTLKSTLKSAEKHLTIWEFFRLYPQTGMIFLLLWKDSTSIELPEPKKDEYNMHLITRKVLDIVQRCPSAIVINPTLLLSEAGSFYEEGQN